MSGVFFPYHDLMESVRVFERRPTMHPPARHQTVAGPARHVLIRGHMTSPGGLVYVGMRKYGPVRIDVFKDPRPARTSYDFKRLAAVAQYTQDKYRRDLINALTDAWRC